MNEICKPYDAKMQKTIEVVKSDFASVRAGRANAGGAGPDPGGVLRYPHAHPAGGQHLHPRPPHSGHPALGHQHPAGDRDAPSRPLIWASTRRMTAA